MKEFKSALTLLAIAGNIIFFLWILYNGINEGFIATWIEKMGYIGMMAILAINAILLSVRKSQQINIVISFLTILAGVGNIIFILFFLYSGITGSSETLPEKLSTFGLIGLLTVDTYLILAKKAPQMQ